jgi:hypothetical protein
VPAYAGTITDASGRSQNAYSQNEINLAWAFDKLGIQYYYQFNIYRAWARTRGGIKIDFLVLPFRVPCELFGEYWHSGDMTPADDLKIRREFEYFHRQTVLFFGDETETRAAALKAANRNKRKLGL